MLREFYRPGLNNRIASFTDLGLSPRARARVSAPEDLVESFKGTPSLYKRYVDAGNIDEWLKNNPGPFYTSDFLRMYGCVATDDKARKVALEGISAIGKEIKPFEKNPLTEEEFRAVHAQTRKPFAELFKEKHVWKTDRRQALGNKRNPAVILRTPRGLAIMDSSVVGQDNESDGEKEEKKGEELPERFILDNAEAAAGLAIVLLSKNWELLVYELKKAGKTDEEIRVISWQTPMHERNVKKLARPNQIENSHRIATDKILRFVRAADQDRDKILEGQQSDPGQFLLGLYAGLSQEDAEFYARDFYSRYVSG